MKKFKKALQENFEFQDKKLKELQIKMAVSLLEMEIPNLKILEISELSGQIIVYFTFENKENAVFTSASLPFLDLIKSIQLKIFEEVF